MSKETKCIVAEQIGEVLIGTTIAIGLNKTVMPKCNTVEKVVVTLGAGIGSWMIGRTFAKKWYKYCNAHLETEINSERIDEL